MTDKPQIKCVESMQTVRTILIALQTKAKNPYYEVNIDERLKDIAYQIHSILITCPELFDVLTLKWITALDHIIEHHDSKK